MYESTYTIYNKKDFHNGLGFGNDIIKTSLNVDFSFDRDHVSAVFGIEERCSLDLTYDLEKYDNLSNSLIKTLGDFMIGSLGLKVYKETIRPGRFYLPNDYNHVDITLSDLGLGFNLSAEFEENMDFSKLPNLDAIDNFVFLNMIPFHREVYQVGV